MNAALMVAVWLAFHPAPCRSPIHHTATLSCGGGTVDQMVPVARDGRT